MEHQRPTGLLQPLEVPEWKWDFVTMDFVIGLPPTQKKNTTIWVIMDRLTKTAHFIAMRNTWTLEQLARAYLEEIVRLYGVPSSIMSDRDTRFQSGFWQKLQEAFGTLLRFSTTFHPATDREAERKIQTLEDVLRACALDFKKAWDEQLALIEFSYNNSYHSSIEMAPYEALYDRQCRTPLCWQEIDEVLTIGPDVIQATTQKIRVIQE